MKEKIKEFVHRMNYVSFSELVRVIPNSSGERAICHNNDSLVLWQGVSVEFAQAIEQLLRDNEIVLTPCETMVYYADRGPIPALPVAKGIKKYSQTHWLPVTVCRP
jgi:hypothetical protein